MKLRSLLLHSAHIFLFTSCHLFEREEPLFTLLEPEATGITFANTITETDTFNVLSYGYIYNGGGVTVGDVNNDGLQDVFFSGNMVSSKLYLNKGDFKFEDVTLKSGTSTSTWANGASMVDINQDGLLDIYICTVNPIAGEPQSPNLLFINKGQDAKGSPIFKEEAEAYKLANVGFSTQAAFFDYDKDGDLDVYILRNAPDRNLNPNIARTKVTDGTSLSTDKLFRNDGNGTFTDVSAEAGILIEGRGLGLAISDVNKDGWPDVYAANDFLTNDLLWINNQDGTFTNKIAQYLKHQTYNGMGTDIADYNNDGLPDIIEVDMLPADNLRQKTTMEAPNYDRFQLNRQMGYEDQYVRNTLQLNNGDGTFSEVGQLAGVEATDWSWSALLADYDNDGWRDLFITNGYVKDMIDLDYVRYNAEQSMFGSQETIEKKQLKSIQELKSILVPNYLYQNRGDLTFRDRSTAWGLEEPSNSNGAAYADLDNDGDLDLVVNNINRKAFVYRNNAEQLLRENNFLRVRLQGPPGNLGGIGATLELRHKGKKQYYEHYLTRGYQSSVDQTAHFGMGQATVVDTVEVTWPDGRYQLLTGVSGGQLLAVDYRDAVERAPERTQRQAPLFREVSGELGLRFRHEEEDYVDFKNQPLMPHKLSQGGPGLAVGDVDGDGLEDFFVGASANRTGTLFMQDGRGGFRSRPLGEPAGADQMGCLLFDADGDGDLDLYVALGGNEQPEGAAGYRDRLYRNDGRGNFRLDERALPDLAASGSCVTAADFDGDGDLDLFVGGRNSPHRYPLPGRSVLLRNEGDSFTDVTEAVCPGLARAGMVTAALWTDFDGDGRVDLAVAGEWMPLSLFRNEEGRLRNVTEQAGLARTEGWWNSLASGDFDSDGDTDYIAGNLGLNSRLKASEREPVRVYAKDFDGDGNVDPVLGYYVRGESYPVATRDALTDQMVSMRRRFTRYADYGEVTLEEMFSQQELAGAWEGRAHTMASSYIENLGGGRFQVRALPARAQFSPVYGVSVADYNGDGHLDAAFVGNSAAAETGMGHYDASYGEVLLGDGRGEFHAAAGAGFRVPADGKAVARLMAASGAALTLASQNGDSLRVFEEVGAAGLRAVRLGRLEAVAELRLRGGGRRRQEVGYGSGYLSQSTRTLLLGPEVERVFLTDYLGNRREVDLSRDLIVIKH